MGILKRLFKNIKEENKEVDIYKNCIFVKETMPFFSDIAKTTNKTISKVKRTLDEDKYLIYELYSYYKDEKTEIFSKRNLISQNTIPIKVYDEKFSTGIFDSNFEKDGFKKGDIYKFNALGYLGNISSIEKILLVTDQYVIFDNGNKVSLRTFDELKRSIKEKIN